MKKALLWIAGIVSILLLVLLIIGWGNPEYQYGNSLVVNAPPAKCFQYFTDTVKLKKWMDGFESQRLISGKHLQPGAQYEFVIRDGERMVMQQQLTGVEPDKKIAYVLTNDVLKSTYGYTLEGDSSQTRVRTDYVVEGNNVFMKAILFLSKSYMADADMESLKSFKKVIESE